MKRPTLLFAVFSSALGLIALFAATEVSAKPGKCRLVIDGKTYISGKCRIEMASDGTGSFQIFESGKRIGYFAQVQIDGEGALGYWNEEKGANHAHTPLGTLTRDGACWKNDRARICAWK